jgi:AcrR family transcriptional regulator
LRDSLSKAGRRRAADVLARRTKRGSGQQERRQAVQGGGPSLERIFEGTLSALSRRGAKQLSMTDVCEAAGISRATLYRYFARKADLLAALSEYVVSRFVEGVKAAAANAKEPHEKLRAVLEFMVTFTSKVKADRILEVEPEFVAKSLQEQFPRHLAAIGEALEPVFRAFEKRLGYPLSRTFISELLLRAQESTTLIPAGARWNTLPETLADFARDFLEEGTGRKPRGRGRGV